MRRCVVAAAIGAAATLSCGVPESDLVVLATTTSVSNSGLLERALPVFERDAAVRVRVSAVGSGRALKMLEEGQADAIVTHAPQQEARALQAHPRWWYRKILYNDFLIAGPPGDPANVAGATGVLEALHRIVSARARFISRGDESGTHERERQLWAAAGLTPGSDIVVSAGQGMGATLNVASQTGAYTLTDRGTFEQFAGKRALKELCSGDPRLLNTYAVLADPANEHGLEFARWIAEGNGRTTVGSLLERGALRGFVVWPSGAPRERPQALPR